MSNQVVGDTYFNRFECRVASTGLLFDPTLVQVSIILGDNSEDTVTYGEYQEDGKLLARIYEGVYEFSYVLPVSGIYRVRIGGNWSSGGRSWPSKSRREILFEVDPDLHTFTDHAASTP